MIQQATPDRIEPRATLLIRVELEPDSRQNAIGDVDVERDRMVEVSHRVQYVGNWSSFLLPPDALQIFRDFPCFRARHADPHGAQPASKHDTDLRDAVI